MLVYDEIFNNFAFIESTTTQLNKQQLNPITTTMKKILLLLLMSFLTLWTADAQNDIVISCPDDNHPHTIDLGLPSGMKWACCNVGADSPVDYGGYYAWGETEEKDLYDWDNYVHYDSSTGGFFFLGPDISGTQYDVAHVKWNDAWAMPSYDQLMELIDKCSCSWATVNGINGGLFTGPNGNTIFLPSPGYRRFDNLYYSGSYGGYWSSTQDPSEPYYAKILAFYCGGEDWYDSCNRSAGISVRPVVKVTNSIEHPKTSEGSRHAVCNLFGIKVASYPKGIDNLLPGIYIVNGKKVVVK